MSKLFKRSKELTVEFCDRCMKVYDAACHDRQVRDQALQHVWHYGQRV